MVICHSELHNGEGFAINRENNSCIFLSFKMYRLSMYTNWSKYVRLLFLLHSHMHVNMQKTKRGCNNINISADNAIASCRWRLFSWSPSISSFMQSFTSLRSTGQSSVEWSFCYRPTNMQTDYWLGISGLDRGLRWWLLSNIYSLTVSVCHCGTATVCCGHIITWAGGVGESFSLLLNCSKVTTKLLYPVK